MQTIDQIKNNVRPNRKDREAINKLAEASIPSEDEFISTLNSSRPFPNFPLRMVQDCPEEGNFATHDAVLECLIDRQRFMTENVEFEWGRDQDKWKNTFGSVFGYWDSLHLLCRKTYTDMTFFCKYNPTKESMFIVYCPWFVSFVESGRISHGPTGHSLQFNTDNEVYKIPWDLTLSEQWREGVNRSGNICLVENSDWIKAWRFMQDRLGLADQDLGFLHPNTRQRIFTPDGTPCMG